MRDILFDLLSNEWGPCREEMFNIWSCGIRDVPIKRAPLYLNCNYLVQTKCIMRKNGEGPQQRKKGWGPGAPPPSPFAPERDVTAWAAAITELSGLTNLFVENLFKKKWLIESILLSDRICKQAKEKNNEENLGIGYDQAVLTRDGKCL